MSVSEFDDPTGEQLIAWTENTMGCDPRIVRSHRRPRQSRRGPATLIALAAAVALGITGVTYTTAPSTDPHTQAQSGQFVAPTDLDALTDRASDDVAATRRERQTIQQTPAKPKPAVKAKAKAKAQSAPTQPTISWANPVTPVSITSCYGSRWGTTHKGIDYNGETGDKVRSVGAGVVVQSGWRFSGLGYSVVVRHSGGWMTLYGHLSKATARPGQKVSAGDLVGLMGSTGNSTGSHLHLGLAKTSNLGSLFDTLTDPAPWLRSRDIPAGRCK